MRRYVPFLLSLKYLRARQFRIGINLVLSPAADTIISSSRVCTRHFSETPISLRYPSIPFLFSYFFFFFYQPILVPSFVPLQSFPIQAFQYRMETLRTFPRKSVTRVSYRLRSFSRSIVVDPRNCIVPTRHLATTDRFRNGWRDERGC